jgi:hypothetical protein
MTPRESGRAMMIGSLCLMIATAFGIFIGFLIGLFWR